MTILLFLIFGFGAVLGALGVLASKNPLHSALSLLGSMICLAVIYLLNYAEFLFAVQLLVYAGAVMMLIIFVIFLLDLKREEQLNTKLGAAKVFGMLMAVVVFGLMLGPLHSKISENTGDMTAKALADVGSVEFLAEKLFGPYLLPFEIASILLLVGLIGAVALAKKRL